MGTITAQNRRALELAASYDDAILTGMIDHEFTNALSTLLEQKKISTQFLVDNTNLSKSYINKLRNPSEKAVQPSRYVIIDIALAIDASLDETNHLLKLARYQELYTRDKAEALIIWGMLRQLSGKRIREILEEKGLHTIFKER